jgi:ACR3 family arsenite transporter
MRFRASAAAFLIAASQLRVVADSLPRRSRVAGVLRAVNLPTSSARTLVVSLGTRNSFVVLPFAPALTDSWNIAVAVILL